MLTELKENINPIAKYSKCQICHGNGYLFTLNELFIIEAKTCCNQIKIENQLAKESNCKFFNEKKFSVKRNMPEDFADKIAKYIKSTHFINSFNVFYQDKLPKLRKNLKHKMIIENIETRSPCRKVEEHQVTNLHLFNRNAIFIILSDKDRAKLTINADNNTKIDKAMTRTFLSLGGNTRFVITGPVVCDYDKRVFDACLRLHHDNNFIGLCLETNFKCIWQKMGNKSTLSVNNKLSLARSLKRLSTVGITVQPCDNKQFQFWSGGILDDVINKESSNSRFSKLEIWFNKHMIPLYLNGSYSTLDMPLLHSLKAYERRILEYVMTHENNKRDMSIEKWREVIGVLDEISMKAFKYRFKEAFLSLKEKGLLEQESVYKKGKLSNEIIHTVINKDKLIGSKFKDQLLLENTQSINTTNNLEKN